MICIKCYEDAEIMPIKIQKPNKKKSQVKLNEFCLLLAGNFKV